MRKYTNECFDMFWESVKTCSLSSRCRTQEGSSGNERCLSCMKQAQQQHTFKVQWRVMHYRQIYFEVLDLQFSPSRLASSPGLFFSLNDNERNRRTDIKTNFDQPSYAIYHQTLKTFSSRVHVEKTQAVNSTL